MSPPKSPTLHSLYQKSRSLFSHKLAPLSLKKKPSPKQQNKNPTCIPFPENTHPFLLPKVTSFSRKKNCIPLPTKLAVKSTDTPRKLPNWAGRRANYNKRKQFSRSKIPGSLHSEAPWPIWNVDRSFLKGRGQKRPFSRDISVSLLELKV